MRTLLPLLLFAATLPLASPAWACACCAAEGERFRFTAELDEFQRSQLGVLAPLIPQATVYMTQAGPDGVSGIRDLEDGYRLSTELVGDQWLWRFRGDKGSGTLTLKLPAQQRQFGVDLPHSPHTGEDRTLYLELELDGTLTGDGIFAPALERPARYELVFQGYGNHCLDAANLSQWRLQARGEGVDFAFYGTLAAPQQARP